MSSNIGWADGKPKPNATRSVVTARRGQPPPREWRRYEFSRWFVSAPILSTWTSSDGARQSNWHSRLTLIASRNPALARAGARSSIDRFGFISFLCSAISRLLKLTVLISSSRWTRFLGSRSPRSEEHTYELQSLMLYVYAVFCLKTKHKT